MAPNMERAALGVEGGPSGFVSGQGRAEDSKTCGGAQAKRPVVVALLANDSRETVRVALDSYREATWWTCGWPKATGAGDPSGCGEGGARTPRTWRPTCCAGRGARRAACTPIPCRPATERTRETPGSAVKATEPRSGTCAPSPTVVRGGDYGRGHRRNVLPERPSGGEGDRDQSGGGPHG